jgi:uncharacterized protein with FMN-binding domain
MPDGFKLTLSFKVLNWINMKKTILIIAAVAILGILGLRANQKTPASSAMNTGTSSAVSTAPTSAATPAANYKDGTYTGGASQTPYGPVQVAAVISGGKITNINLLQLPSEENESRQISNNSGPQLRQKAISAQSAKIDFVSGATSTSSGFEQSLQAALDQAAS